MAGLPEIIVLAVLSCLTYLDASNCFYSQGFLIENPHEQRGLLSSRVIERILL
ncbi:hypothetical protein CLAVI_000957 [Candidatus Clavichlamydia salmonicola]|uniref:hypothetical protein n=1 Tax=Candidatus Clavichlamydia salmonicola TaxID=469812 RepID=UPI0018918483|nr:hypothetical protein [Candidatus Clavichlamydia salmonicola]MBF5051316.1 hypothetical protein [Candidatus Clavichlamydia salmonicola]